MSDIGDMIERGGEGPEWVERESNDALRKEIELLRQSLDAAEVQAEHYRTMSLARQEEIERQRAERESLRRAIRDEWNTHEAHIDCGCSVCGEMIRWAWTGDCKAGGGDE